MKPQVIQKACPDALGILRQAAAAIEPPVAKAIRVAQAFFEDSPGQRITVAELARQAGTAPDTARSVLEGLHERGAIQVKRGRGPRPDTFWLEPPDDDPDPGAAHSGVSGDNLGQDLFRK